MKQANTISEVIESLDQIIEESKKDGSPLGYFAALYRKVTIKVKEGINQNFFDDGERMEKLDVVFANRYLTAYDNFKNNKEVTDAWRKAFDLSDKYWPIVLQHLLIGMNAHINLDLGIAAAEISAGKNIDSLHDDFNKINEILSSLVKDVQDDLASIWPMLRKILKLTGKVDDFLVDFSMTLARNGAWKFANKVYNTAGNDRNSLIHERDKKVAKMARLINNPGLIPNIIFRIIRLGEKGNVEEKIKRLED